MYFTDGNDSTDSRVLRADLDGTNVEDLITSGLHQPNGIVLDLLHGHMYIADGSNLTARILRANLDGSDVQAIVPSATGFPIDLVILDGCPTDPLKLDPGACGCGAPDDDTDLDGVADCIDNCASAANPTQMDADSDGAGDACDGCPNDSTKTDPGACGCGNAETDADGNGTPDCAESMPAPQNMGGCCAPGVFPTVGMLLPALLLLGRTHLRRPWRRFRRG